MVAPLKNRFIFILSSTHYADTVVAKGEVEFHRYLVKIVTRQKSNFRCCNVMSILQLDFDW